MNANLPRVPPPVANLGPPLRGGDIARAVALGLGLFGLAFLIIRELAGDVTGSGARINALLAFFAAWCFAWLAAIWIVFVRLRGMSLADLGYTVPERKWAARGVLFAFAALPLAYLLLALLRPALDIKSGAGLQQLFGPDFSVIHAAALLLYGGFLVPLAEELLFRGLLFRWLRQRLAFWPAAIVSAAAFGLAHLRLDQIAVATLLGLPLAWLYEKSRSLAPAIVMHQAYNSLVLMLTYAIVWMPPPPQT